MCALVGSRPVCFRFSQPLLDYKLGEDFLAYCFTLLVVQIFEAAYHRSENNGVFGGIIVYFHR